MKPALRLLPAILGSLLLSPVFLCAGEPLLSETWQGLKAGDDIMQSGRWSMGQGSRKQLILAENALDSRLVLTGVAGGTTPVALSLARFPLDGHGLTVAAEAAFTGPDDEFQLGVRGADTGGGSLTSSYRMRVTGSTVFLNRFPTVGKGPQKLLASQPRPETAPGAFQAFALKVTPLSESESRVEVSVDGRTLLSAVSKSEPESGVPALDGTVRAFLLIGKGGAQVRQISVSRGE